MLDPLSALRDFIRFGTAAVYGYAVVGLKFSQRAFYIEIEVKYG